MNRLTLTPERCSAPDSFAEGCYAYAFADRPVRYKGEVITPRPLYIQADENGRISFDLIPNGIVDERIEFSYTIATFDNTGQRMWSANIVMPAADTLIWDLIPQSVNLDAPIHIDFVCNPSTNEGPPDTQGPPPDEGMYANEGIPV